MLEVTAGIGILAGAVRALAPAEQNLGIFHHHHANANERTTAVLHTAIFAYVASVAELTGRSSRAPVAGRRDRRTPAIRRRRRRSESSQCTLVLGPVTHGMESATVLGRRTYCPGAVHVKQPFGHRDLAGAGRLEREQRERIEPGERDVARLVLAAVVLEVRHRVDGDAELTTR